MKCPNPDCQRIIPDDAKFCKYCGRDTLKAYTEIINNDISIREPLWKAGVISGICLAVVLLIMAIAVTMTNKSDSMDEGDPLKIEWNSNVAGNETPHQNELDNSEKPKSKEGDSEFNSSGKAKAKHSYRTLQKTNGILWVMIQIIFNHKEIIVNQVE